MNDCPVCGGDREAEVKTFTDEKVEELLKSQKVAESAFRIYTVNDVRLNAILREARLKGDGPEYREERRSENGLYAYYYKPTHVFAWLDELGIKYSAEVPVSMLPSTNRKIKDLGDMYWRLKKDHANLKKSYEGLTRKAGGVMDGRDQFGLLNEGMVLQKSRPISLICGIYFLVKNYEIVYVGQSVNIFARLGQHLPDKEFDSYCFVEAAPEQLNRLEADYIEKFKPKYNKATPWSPLRARALIDSL